MMIAKKKQMGWVFYSLWRLPGNALLLILICSSSALFVCLKYFLFFKQNFLNNFVTETPCADRCRVYNLLSQLLKDEALNPSTVLQPL